MAEDPVGAIQQLRSQKVKLIEILSADPDFVLQHADSCSLLSPSGYQQVKSCRIPSEKVRDLLDHVIHRGPTVAQGLLDLLLDQALQNTFPMLHFMKDLQVNSLSSAPDLQEQVKCSNGSHLVKEKQLMTVARAIGRSWREIGRQVLEIPSVKLEQIEEDHSIHAERVFAMLRYWRSCQREKATAAQLHSLLSHEHCALPPESIDFLLESS